MPGQRPLQHEPQKPIQLLPNQKDEVLKVSPTTKLPTKFDRFILLNPVSPEEQINLHTDWKNINPEETHILNELFGEGTYDPDIWDDAPRSVKKVKKILGIIFGGDGFEADPVRAYQARKAAKRQIKVNNVLNAYGMKKGDVLISTPPDIKFFPDSLHHAPLKRE